jgi:hypothetical protein
MLLPNLGTLDRVLRVVLGIALLALGLARGPETWWAWFGVIRSPRGWPATARSTRWSHVRTRS